MPGPILVCITATAILLSHPVPDGLVFRGIQVVVRSDRIEIRYQVGLSDAMIRRELAAAESVADPTTLGSVEALAEYRDMMFPRLLDQMMVRIDGRPVRLTPHRADIVRQEHAQLEFGYRVGFELDPQPQRFDLLDENYSGVPGFHLAAIRGRGDVLVVPAGSQQLYQRLPDIPDPTNVEAAPLPTVRKLEALLQPAGGSSSTEPQPPGGDLPNGNDRQTRAAPADGNTTAPPADEKQTPPATGTAAPRAEMRGERSLAAQTAAGAAGRKSPDDASNVDGRVEPVALVPHRWLWVAGFGSLAAVIALAWLYSSLRGS